MGTDENIKKLQEIYNDSFDAKAIEFAKRYYPTFPNSLVSPDILKSLQWNLDLPNSLYPHLQLDRINHSFDFSRLNEAFDAYKKSMEPLGNSLENIAQSIRSSGLDKIAREFAIDSFSSWQDIPLENLPDISTELGKVQQIQDSIRPELENLNSLLESAGTVQSQFELIKNRAQSLLPIDFDFYKEGYQNLPAGSILQGKVEELVIPRLYVKGEHTEYPLSSQPQIEGVQSLFKGLGLEEIVDFRDYLLQFPMLGHKHPTGRIIFEEMERLLLSSEAQYFYDISDDQFFYRCREWENPDREDHYSEYEMFQPPFGRSSMGRFNPPGMSYLYMSSSRKTAMLEAGIKQEHNRLTIIKALLKKRERVLELSKKQNLVFTSCLHPNASDNRVSPPQYMVSNYVSQCFINIVKQERLNIVGIRYESVHKEGTYSFVFFDHGESLFDDESKTICTEGI